MTRDEAVAEYAAHVERNGGTSMFTEDQWVDWRLKPAGYRMSRGGVEVPERMFASTYFERASAAAYDRLPNGGRA